MRTNSTPQVDLVRLFNAVTSTLKENQPALNAADEYNHNHGDNMVDTFQSITRALRAKKGSLPADQLAYASQIVSQQSQSGSAQLYSQGLAQAADRLQGKPAVTQADAMLLIQSLLGGQSASQQSQPAEDDLLGGLLGSLMGKAPVESSTQSGAGQESSGIDMNALLTAGIAFVQARQQGVEPMTALVQAILSGSQLQATPHRSQSGQLVAESLINALGKMLSSKK